MAEILHPTRENFDDMLSRNHLVLVDFWAPCRMAAPVIEQLANLYQGRVAVAKVNVDEQQELAVRFGIQSIPTILVFKNGALQASEIGVKSLASYTGLLDNLLQA